MSALLARQAGLPVIDGAAHVRPASHSEYSPALIRITRANSGLHSGQRPSRAQT
jgi:hypothetical protein